MPELAHSSGFLLYPRGFFGAQLSPAIKQYPRPFTSDVKRLQNNLSLLRGMGSGDQLVVNERVEVLYGESISKVVTFDKFDFRERVYKAALEAFGTNEFDFWYTQQRYSPSAGELHHKYLLDTLQFIETGRRDLANENWNVLVSLGDRKGDLRGMVDQRAQEFFGITGGGFTRQPRNTRLLDVLQRWCSQPGGTQDLLFTLHILFGKL